MFLTPREASDLLGLSAERLSGYRRRRQGPDYYKFGRLVRYRLQDLLEWAEARRSPCAKAEPAVGMSEERSALRSNAGR